MNTTPHITAAAEQKSIDLRSQEAFVTHVYCKENPEDKIGIAFQTIVEDDDDKSSTNEKGKQWVIISKVNETSPFHGIIMPGSKLISINGITTSSSLSSGGSDSTGTVITDHWEAVKVIQQSPSVIEIKVQLSSTQRVMEILHQNLNRIGGWEKYDTVKLSRPSSDMEVWSKVFCQCCRPGATYYFVMVCNFTSSLGGAGTPQQGHPQQRQPVLDRPDVARYCDMCYRTAQQYVGFTCMDLLTCTGPGIAVIPVLITSQCTSEAAEYCTTKGFTAPGRWGHPILIETKTNHMYVGKKWIDIGESGIQNLLQQYSFSVVTPSSRN
jgi:hypothetical protein